MGGWRVLVALLAILGVNLIVIVVLLAFVLSRKRWVKRQPGSLRGAIRVSGGEIDGLPPKRARGYGRWVRDVLVWTKAPFYLRNELVPADGLEQPTPGRPRRGQATRRPSRHRAAQRRPRHRRGRGS